MMVITADGQRVGKVVKVGASDFMVEKGLFFKKDYLCLYDDVQGTAGDELRIARTMGQLRELPKDYWEEGATARTAGPSTSEPTTARPTTGYTQETRVPLAEEKLAAEKTAREKGGVTIHKEVKTETKRVDVPIKKEEVTVSRTAADRPPAPGEATFKESSVSVPVVEEEVEVTKRPVVREEVRATKSSHEEMRSAEAEVRREEARIENRPENKPEYRPDKPGLSGPGRR
jgi:uncharacterized protein (TIGR02271 family)